MEEFIIQLQARIDEEKSKGTINSDIEILQDKLNALKLQATIDTESINKIAKEIENLTNNTVITPKVSINNNQVNKVAHDLSDSLDKIIRKETESLAKDFGLKNGKVLTEIKNALTEYYNEASNANNATDQFDDMFDIFENGSPKINKVTSAIVNNMKVADATKKVYADLVDYIAKTNSSLSKIHLPHSIKEEYGDMFSEMRSTLGSAFTTGAGTDFETFVTELNAQLGNIIDMSRGAEYAFGDLVKKVSSARGNKNLSGKDLIDIGMLDLTEVESRIKESIGNIENEYQKLTQTSANAANTVIQNEEKKQQAFQDTLKVQEQLTEQGNIIHQTDFSTSFFSKEEAQEYFNTLSKAVSIQEKLGENQNLESFIVEVKNAKGVVEKLTYKYNELSGAFEYSGGSINNSGVIKQINTITAKAEDLQKKLNSLQSDYSNVNATRPIKNSENISALSKQYDKVSQSIEAVRNADNTTFSSMTSNAQKEISILESMIKQFRDAENVATQMKSTDISSGIAQAQERLGKLKANASNFEQMTQVIHELEIAIEGVGDKSSLDSFIDKLRVAESQLDRVKAEAKELAKANDIQFSISDNGDVTTQIDILKNNFRKLGLSADEAKAKISGVDHELAELKALLNNGASNSALTSQFKKLQSALKEAQNDLKATRSEYSLLASNQQRLAKANIIEAWNLKNRNATQDVRNANESYITSLRDLDMEMSKLKFNEISDGFSRIKNSMTALGKISTAVKGQLAQVATSLVSLMSLSRVVMQAVNWVTRMPSTVTALDTALVDLRKTANMSTQELEDFYYASNDVAKQMGVTTEEILKQAAAWSRFNNIDPLYGDV